MTDEASRTPNPKRWRDGRPLPPDPLRVAIDIDGVLAVYLDTMSALAYGKVLPEPCSYEAWRDPAWPCDDLDGFMEDHGRAVGLGLYAKEPCRPDVAWATQRLVTGEDGVLLDVVTSRRDDDHDATMGWLTGHAIAFDDLVHVREPADKAMLGYDVIIDDDPVVLQTAMAVGAVAVAPEKRWTRDLGCRTYRDGMTLNRVTEWVA